MGYSGSCSASTPLSLCCHLLSTGTSTSTSTSSRASAVTPPPLVASLSFSWVLRFPAHQPLPLVVPPPGTSASGIHHASTFCSTPLAWLVVALPGASPPLSLLLRPVLPLVAPLSFGWFVALSGASAYHTDGCCVASCHVAASCASTPCIRPVRRLLHQGVAPRRERVQVDAMQCSGNTVGVGWAKEPVVRPSCDKTCTKLL